MGRANLFCSFVWSKTLKKEVLVVPNLEFSQYINVAENRYIFSEYKCNTFDGMLILSGFFATTWKSETCLCIFCDLSKSSMFALNYSVKSNEARRNVMLLILETAEQQQHEAWHFVTIFLLVGFSAPSKYNLQFTSASGK